MTSQIQPPPRSFTSSSRTASRLLPAPFLLSYSVFILFFLIFRFCAVSFWAQVNLTLTYRIVSYVDLSVGRNWPNSACERSMESTINSENFVRMAQGLHLSDYKGIIYSSNSYPLSSNRQRLSIGGKIIRKRSVLYCVRQLCAMIRIHMWTVLKFACCL